jgi:hypothetical protein
MTPNRNLIAMALIVTIAAACTDPGVVEEPLATPDVFAPTPTIVPEAAESTTTTRPIPTTTIEVEQTALFRVDPMTLEPLPGFNPIPAGDYFWGSASENGHWLAGYANDEDGGVTEVRLVDVTNWEVVASWQPVGSGEPYVTDRGVVYYAQGGPSWPTLKRLRPGADDEVASDLPEGFSPSSPIHQQGPLIAVFGTTGDWGLASEEPMIATVDLSSGVVTAIELPQVTYGPIEEVDIGESWSPFVGAYPGLVWDGGRALIVHADRDVVTEVDLVGGEVTDHRFGPEASALGSLFAWLASPAQAGGMPMADSTRSAQLSPDGRRLYVATRVGEAVVASEDDWYLGTQSIGLEVIDTETWARIDRLDAPIGEVHLSPDGTRLIGWGFTQEDRLSSTKFESHGVFVIDTTSLEVLAHHEGPDDWYYPISFSSDGRFGYLTTWSETSIIDLASGEMIGNRSAAGFQVWGEAGVATASNH